MNFDWDALQDFKNHYRGLASHQNWRLVRIRTFLEKLESKSTNHFISDEDWAQLMELVKPELYKLPSKEAMEIDLILTESL